MKHTGETYAQRAARRYQARMAADPSQLVPVIIHVRLVVSGRAQPAQPEQVEDGKTLDALPGVDGMWETQTI